MKVGLFITNQNFLDKDMVSARDEQFAMVHLARDRGWNSVFTGQHYLNEGNNKQLQAVPLSVGNISTLRHRSPPSWPPSP